jgi:hypothetical protein
MIVGVISLHSCLASANVFSRENHLEVNELDFSNLSMDIM